MATLLARIFKYGWQNFSRGRWLSAATLTVIVLALIVFQGLIIFTVVTKTSIAILKEKIDISVYFKPESSETDMAKMIKAIEELPETASVEFISREKALAEFKTAHADDPAITQALAELEENPLSAVLNVKAENPGQYGAIAAKIDAPEWQKIVGKVTYRQNQAIIDRLGKAIDVGNRLGLIITMLLTVTAIIVTFNTVSLAIYSNRDEIGIMRLVGAPASFISGPYMVEGVIYGVIGAAASLAILWPAVYWGAPYLKYFITGLDLRAYVLDHAFALAGYQLIFGIALGVISSNFAIQKYLKI